MSSRRYVRQAAVSLHCRSTAGLLPVRAVVLSVGISLLLSCSQPSGAPDGDAAAVSEAVAGAHRENYIEDANVVELSLAAQERGGIQVEPATAGPVSASVLVGRECQSAAAERRALLPSGRAYVRRHHLNGWQSCPSR